MDRSVWGIFLLFLLFLFLENKPSHAAFSSNIKVSPFHMPTPNFTLMPTGFKRVGVKPAQEERRTCKHGQMPLPCGSVDLDGPPQLRLHCILGVEMVVVVQKCQEERGEDRTARTMCTGHFQRKAKANATLSKPRAGTTGQSWDGLALSTCNREQQEQCFHVHVSGMRMWGLGPSPLTIRQSPSRGRKRKTGVRGASHFGS